MANWYKINSGGTNYYYYANDVNTALEAMARDYPQTAGDVDTAPQQISADQVPDKVVSMVTPNYPEAAPQAKKEKPGKDKEGATKKSSPAEAVAQAEIPPEEAKSTVPFEESAIAAQAMANADMEAKAYEDYYGNLIAETNGDYELTAENLKQAYALALENDNQESARLLENVAQELENNKHILGKQAEQVASQGIESLNLAEEYRQKKEGQIREEYETGRLRVKDDLKYLQEELGIESGDLVADLERAERLDQEDYIRELEGIAQVYRQKMEDMAADYEARGLYRGGERLSDMADLMSEKDRADALAYVEHLRPVEELGIEVGRRQRDIISELGRAEELSEREIEDLQMQMQEDLAALDYAGEQDKLALKQRIEDSMAALYENLGEGAAPMIQQLQAQYGGMVGGFDVPEIKSGFMGRLGTASEQEKARVASEMTAKYGSIAGMAPAMAIKKLESGDLTPTELGAAGLELAQKFGYRGEPGTLERERGREVRELGWDLEAGRRQAYTGALESGRQRYYDLLAEGQTPAMAGDRSGTARSYKQYVQGKWPGNKTRYEPRYPAPKTGYRSSDTRKAFERILSGR